MTPQGWHRTVHTSERRAQQGCHVRQLTKDDEGLALEKVAHLTK